MGKTERSAVVLEVMEGLRKVSMFERQVLMNEVAEALGCEFLASSVKPLSRDINKMGAKSAAEAVIMASIAVADAYGDHERGEVVT